jgi:hypothetical protein
VSGSIKRVNTCGNCVYVEATGNRKPDGQPELVCRFNPPVPHPIFAQNGEGGVNYVGTMSIWPEVQAIHWCSHHKKQLIEPARDLPKQLQSFGVS